MKPDHVNRRDFHKLTMAAMGGMMAGSFAGCGRGDKTSEETAVKTGKEAGEAGTSGDTTLAAWTDHHVCQGLNACKGLGKGGTNACAGQGECATATAHACHTDNDCRYQGGCQDSVASNECKGKGECAVPLSETTWEKAYKKFKADMEKAGKADLLPKEPPGPPKSE